MQQAKSVRERERDSVWVMDSVFVLVKGDTLIRDRWRTVYRDRWRDRVERDTAVVRVRVRELEYRTRVENRVPGWCWWTIGGLLVVLVLIVLVFFRR